jgi:cytochrome c-type biogenesis protein CcmF
MVIHPPIVFLGYAALAVPFSYALGGLLSAKHETWIKEALPWALFASTTLGAGIFIGGYWAYKVLGWGGYWAWDPVENASLVPWLVSVSLIHLLLLARKRPAAIAAAYIAAIFSFGLVLYGTFLTRSGVLSDFSTHSFADVGIGGILGTFIVITMAAALGMMLWRWSSLPGGELYPSAASREFILAGTALVFAVFAALVLIGMSTPLITMLSGTPQNVSTSFYNATSLPLAAAILVLLSVGPKLKWDVTNVTLREFLGIGSVGVLAVVMAISLGLYHSFMLLVIGCSFAALMANSIAVIRRNGLDLPAGVAHIGVAVAVIGIIVSSAGGKSVTESLERGTARELLGAKITYIGTEITSDGKGYNQNFKVEGKQTYILHSLTKLNNDGKAAAREPGIHRGLQGDLYLAPVMQHNQDIGKELALRKGEQTAAEGLTVRFIYFGMNNSGNGEIRVFAQLEVTKDGVMQEVRPELIARNGQLQPIPLKAFDQYQIMLTAVNTREGAVSIAIRDLSRTAAESVSVEVSYKPLVSLVWLGAFLITIGTGWAVIKRI